MEIPPLRFSSTSVPSYNRCVWTPNRLEILRFSLPCPFSCILPFHLCISEPSVVLLSTCRQPEKHKHCCYICINQPQLRDLKLRLDSLFVRKKFWIFVVHHFSCSVCFLEDWKWIKIETIVTPHLRINVVGRSLAFSCSKPNTQIHLGNCN